MTEATGWAFFCMCIAAVLLAITVGMTHYHLKELEVMERLARDHGINPMLVDCMGKELSKSHNLEICKMALEQYNLRLEDLAKLKKTLGK